MNKPAAFWLPLLLLIVLASGCATKRIVNQWSNPDYTGAAHFKKIVVVGVTDQTAVRRNFEDHFAAKLRSMGIDAAPYISETTLYDARNQQVIWSGMIRTIDPDATNDALDDYVDTVIAALKENHLLRG